MNGRRRRIIGSALLAVCLLSGLAAQVRQEWVARYNGYGNAFDVPTALTVDPTGNVYVTGYSDNLVTTIKYAPDGTQLWVARYTAQVGRARAIAIDTSGNVYVAGRGGNDYLTIKYAPDGTQLWVATYNGFEGEYSDDEALAIATDSAGNVYVTGTSYGGATGRDIATIKYDANGNPLWVARYGNDGSASSEEARALAIDAAGNVVVCGLSIDPETGVSIVTIKYDASGSALWIARFYGLHAAFPASLQLDRAGNVYVAGTTLSDDPENARIAMVTVKYNLQGDLMWVAYHNASDSSRDRAGALAVDERGDVYVAGTAREAGASDDFVLVKYDGEGNLLWSERYNSPQDRHDTAIALALDPADALLVMGHSSDGSGEPILATILKYTRDGVRQWVAQHPFDHSVARAIGIDRFGTVTLAGSSQMDFVTVRFNSAGQRVWTAQYNGPGWTTDAGVRVTMDRSGNLLVLGYTYDGYTLSDFLLLKYLPNGRLIWQERYDSGGSDSPSDFALDGSGNLYVTGFSHKTGEASSCVLMKYDAQGNRLWLARYRSPDPGDARARFLAVDPLGSVYVVGEIYNAEMGRYNPLILRYDPNGNLLWARREEDSMYPDHIGQDQFGNLYLIAYAGAVYRLSKYNPAGERLWSVTATAWECRISVDPMGNAYVAGHEGNRYVLAKYSPQGNLLWLSARPVTEVATPRVMGILLDDRGHLYVTMQAAQDALTVKYTVDGQMVWERRYRGPEGSENLPRDIALDLAGNIYITLLTAFQSSSGSPYHADWHTLKYEPNGREAWVMRFDGELEYDDDSPAGLFVDRAGNVYVVGSAYMHSEGIRLPSLDLILVKYSQPPIGDIDGNSCVDDSDLLAVLNDFGRQGDSLATDINQDSIVDDADLLILLFNFGAGC